MADIRLDHLVKTYPGTDYRATDDVSLAVADGEFVVLLGPSGCGKTTLLRMIAGLELPDQGLVAIGGRDVTYLPARDRQLSMVFQSYAIFPHRSVASNISFGLRMRKVPKDEIERRVADAARLLKLEPYLNRLPAQLSGGQRQRVAVARAIVADSEVLLMDEPLSNLDALLRMEFRSELKSIVQRLDTTTVYVTHDQVEALSLGDRIAVMDRGRIAQLGTPLEVYDTPASTFVGGFIGSPPMNFLSGTLRESAGGPVFDTGGQTVAAPSSLGSFVGKPLTLGIRAEHIGLETGDGPGLTATVSVVEPLGAATLVTATVGEAVVKVQTGPRTRVEPGGRVRLVPDGEAVRFYDAESGLELTPVGAAA